MAVKNMQNLEMRGVRSSDVGVTGMVCKGSQRTDGRFPAPILSLVRLPLPGLYPIQPADAALAGSDNPQAAKAERTGRSTRGVLAGATRQTWRESRMEHRKPMFAFGMSARG